MSAGRKETAIMGWRRSGAFRRLISRRRGCQLWRPFLSLSVLRCCAKKKNISSPPLLLLLLLSRLTLPNFFFFFIPAESPPPPYSRCALEKFKPEGKNIRADCNPYFFFPFFLFPVFVCYQNTFQTLFYNVIGGATTNSTL